jgi:hypothetical protein
MRDENLAEMLGAISQKGTLRSLTIKDEKLGQKTMEVITELLAKQRPNSLLELHLVNCKALGQQLTQQLLLQLLSKSYLTSLTLSGFNFMQNDKLDQESLQNSDELMMSLLCEVLDSKCDNVESSMQENLTSLDLSYLNLSASTLIKLMKILKHNTKL